MPDTVRVLLVEDSATDAKLVVRELQRGGIVVEFERVETAETMGAALERTPWDLVLSDWAMPRFSALAALGMVKDKRLDLPFIVVSGAIGEDTAVDAMHAGVADYVLKDKLARLVPAVRRVLRECEERRARRMAEESLGRSEARFRTLAESGLVGIIVTEASGKIVEANDAFLRMVGHSRAEVSSQTLTPPEWAAVDQRASRELTAKGVASLREKEYLRRDGSRVPVMVGSAAVDGAADAVLSFVVDVSRSQLAVLAVEHLREARASEAMFRGLLEAAPDAMLIVGEDGLITLVNAQAERLFGYARAELLGTPIERLVPERFRDGHPAHRGRYFSARKARAMGAGLDLRGLRKDGSEFPAEISLGPIETAGGTFITAAVRDVTEQRLRQQAEARRRSLEVEAENRRMHETNRLKSEFVANMSHELRTPLNAIIGFSGLLSKGKIGQMSPEQKEYIDDILTGAQHLHQLINDVLDVAKVESGKMEFRPERVDIGALLTEVRDILRGLAAIKRIRLETHHAQGLTAILDAGRLKQVLYNYVSNALKFTPDFGVVTVRVVRERAGGLRLEVEDTGIGIRPDDIGRLFVEFQQLDAGAGKKFGGTGLGLALTKRIVEAQGGQVGVRSEVGTGSTFWAVLPAHEA